MISRWIKRLRATLDMTQEMLADQVGCSVETIRAIESGRRRPSRPMGERLADVLQVPPDERAEFLRQARLPVERAADAAAQAVDNIPPGAVATGAAIRAARLPVPPTTLIGREAEAADVCRRLSEPACRLLTLVGAGGTGKTRLALQVAMQMQGQFADGVSFVALAQVAHAEHVATAIAEALNCPLMATRPPEDSVLSFLRDRDLLLVLDNLEHLLDTVPLLAAILREAPGVRLLATSRERLRVQGEWIVELAGLRTPADDTRDEIERSDAVLLFLERARQVSGDFALTAANRSTVAHVCRLMDGMPLGIELAAAWVRALDLDEIVAEMTRGLDFLTLSDRDVDPRHRSMRSVIDHSWRLLTPGEQRVLARLAVFRGGCRREAAAAVAGASLPMLLALIDKSLLRRTTGAAGGPRYEMHELVRQYAADRLAADPEAAADAHDRHCAYYAGWIAAIEPVMKSQQQYRAVAEISADIDNLRAAWQHAVDHRQVDRLGQMVVPAGLLWFYELKSWYQEGAMIARRAVAAIRALPTPSREAEIILGTIVGVQGWYIFRYGEPEQGLRLLEHSQALLRPGDHPVFLFFTQEQLAYFAFFNGEFDRAVALVEEQQPLVARIADPWIEAHALFQRAVIYADRAPEIAYARFREALPSIRLVGDSYILILSLNHLGEVALARGRADEAYELFVEALERSAEVGNGVGEVVALNGMARVACARHAWPEAIRRGQAAMVRARAIGDTWSKAKVLVSLGEAETGGGDQAAARAHFAQAITFGMASHVLPTAIEAWLGLAALDTRHAAPDEPLLTLLALIRVHPATSHAAMQQADRLWAALQPGGDDPRFAAAESAARALAPDRIGALLSRYVGDAPGRVAPAPAVVPPTPPRPVFPQP